MLDELRQSHLLFYSCIHLVTVPRGVDGVVASESGTQWMLDSAATFYAAIPGAKKILEEITTNAVRSSGGVGQRIGICFPSFSAKDWRQGTVVTHGELKLLEQIRRQIHVVSDDSWQFHAPPRQDWVTMPTQRVANLFGCTARNITLWSNDVGGQKGQEPNWQFRQTCAGGRESVGLTPSQAASQSFRPIPRFQKGNHVPDSF